MKGPLFSVIVPTRDRPELLGQALASVLAQDLQDFEVLVIDDGSSMPLGTPKDRRIRLIRNDLSRGEFASRNVGLRAAEGRNIAFLDDDDLWLPQRLTIAAHGLAKAAIAVCGSDTSKGPGSLPRTLQGQVGDIILNGMTPNLGQTAMRRNAALMFDERFTATGDVEWWLRATQRHDVYTDQRVGFVYRYHDAPRVGNGVDRRIECSHLLLDLHREYFRAHPRAHAFRLFRLGMLEVRAGHRREARAQFFASLRVRPTWLATKHLLGAYAMARG